MFNFLRSFLKPKQVPPSFLRPIDFWRYLYPNLSENYLAEIMELCRNDGQEPEQNNHDILVVTGHFSRVLFDTSNNTSNLFAMHPYIKAAHYEEFKIMDGLIIKEHAEAFIIINHPKTECTLTFFAVDYVFKSALYQTNSKLNIGLVGIARIIKPEKPLQMPAIELPNGQKISGFDNNFCSIMPTEVISVYNIFGKIISLEKKVLGQLSGCLISIKVTPEIKISIFASTAVLKNELNVDDVISAQIALTGTTNI